MDREQKQVIEQLENIVYLYNRESRGWHDCNDIRLNSNDIKAIEKAIELVKAIPSTEPKTGYWIEEFNDLEGEVRFTCSSCGKYQLFETDYCYNCGAEMVDEQESEVNNG